MITMVVSDDDVHESTTIELTYWLYYMIVYYILQIICIINVCIKRKIMMNFNYMKNMQLPISICYYLFVNIFVFDDS